MLQTSFGVKTCTEMLIQWKDIQHKFFSNDNINLNSTLGIVIFDMQKTWYKDFPIKKLTREMTMSISIDGGSELGTMRYLAVPF